MSNLLAIITGVTALDLSQVYTIPAGQTAESIAEQLGLSFLQWAEFDQAVDFPGTEDWPTAFELEIGVGDSKTVVFNLGTAKVSASNQVKSQYSTLESAATEGYSANQLASQGALPEIDRLPEIQVVIDSVNTLAVELSTKLAAIDAATTIDEVNNVVNPPTGTIFTGRGGSGGGPLDMNPSTMVTWNSTTIDVADTELYIPASSSVVPYDAGLAPYTYAQTFAAFTTGNYTVQLRQASNSSVLAEWECPLEPVNVPIDF